MAEQKTVQSIRTAVAGLLLVGLLGIGGCSRDAEPGEVGLEPSAVAADIVAEFDKDKDGQLSKSELKASKSLAALADDQALEPLDANGDGSVAVDELEAKIQRFVEVNRVSFKCFVTFRGQPLEGAEVRLVPESFMGDSLTEAVGTTDDAGFAEVEDGGEFGGMVSGLYRVEITHPDVKLKAKYNTDTTLALCVDGTNPYVDTVRFKLQ